MTSIIAQSSRTQTTVVTQPSAGYALLIGVDRYPELGDGAQLKGSCNDVLMWHWFCRQQLGIPPENIRMLTSPALDPNKDFGGDAVPAETVGEATEDAIRKGRAWLLASMNRGETPGLLAYSGHGLLVGNAPALSTSSTKSDLSGAILLSDIGKAVQDAGAQEALTAVFDCCHLAAPSSKSDLRASTGLSFGADDAADIEDEAFNVSHRVFLAARPGQSAYQCKLGRNIHGALSFALVTAGEQWKASQAAGQTGLDVNHKELFKRARKLLRSLRMKQSPKLRVPFGGQSRSLMRKMPFFGLRPDETMRKPDAERDQVQLTPNWDYTITYSSGGITTLANVVVIPGNNVNVSNGASTCGLYLFGQEFWYVNTLSTNPSSLSLTIQGTQFSSGGTAQVDASFNPFRPTQSCSEQDLAAWSQTLSAPSTNSTTANYVFFGTPASPSGVTAYLLINATSTTSGSSTTYTINHVQWYLTYSTTPASGPVGGVLQPAGTKAVTYAYYGANPPPAPTGGAVYGLVSF